MKGLVIFDTSYGNTRKIAETISETLTESGIGVETIYVKKVRKPSAKQYDFLVLGSPTRFGTMSFTFKSFLGKIDAREWSNRPFAVFDTETRENIEKKEGSAAEKIGEKLREKNMKQLLPGLKAVVSSNLRCTLDPGEIERAADYARQLAAQLKN